MEDCERLVSLHMQGDGIEPARETAEHIGISDVLEWLDGVEEKIKDWDAEKALSLDAEPGEAEEFARTVDEVQDLAECMDLAVQRKTSLRRAPQIRDRARGLLRSAMAKLEDQFIRILNRYQQLPDVRRLSFQSAEEGDGSLNTSFDEDSFGRRFDADSLSYSHSLFDPVDPAAVVGLKFIAELMCRSGYGGECVEAYVSTRKVVVEESLASLQLGRASMEELMAMNSNAIGLKIKMWNQAMKVFCQIYLSAEKKLCDGVFGPIESAASFCSSTEGSLFQLLIFGKGIALSPPEYVKIFGLLNMLECLADLLPLLEDLSSSSATAGEFLDLQAKLGDSVVASFFKFKECVLGYSSSSPYPQGGPFPLTKYVMNYIAALAEYEETLGDLLRRRGGESDREGCPLRRALLSVADVLEEKIRSKSGLYADDALRHFFVMNNLRYMVNKASESNLRELLGEDWIRARKVRIRQLVLSYQRISWSPIVQLFRDEEGLSHRSALKERFKRFNHAFEEIYKIQTGWLIPDERLREDVVISISMNVLRAYRLFTARHEASFDGVRRRERYIKFSVDDLHRLVLDLFLGTAKSLPPRFRAG